MKKLILTLVASGFYVGAQADIALNGPGVPPGAATTASVPFKVSYVLANSYRFIFGGIQAKGDTLGAPGNSGSNGNGGQFHLSASASSGVGSASEGKIDFRDVQDYNTAPLKTILTSPAVSLKATTTPITITLEWKGEGNAHKPNGTFTIIGEYQPVPPPPVGNLTFAVGDWLLIAAGAQPPGIATVTRE